MLRTLVLISRRDSSTLVQVLARVSMALPQPNTGIISKGLATANSTVGPEPTEAPKLVATTSIHLHLARRLQAASSTASKATTAATNTVNSNPMDKGPSHHHLIKTSTIRTLTVSNRTLVASSNLTLLIANQATTNSSRTHLHQRASMEDSLLNSSTKLTRLVGTNSREGMEDILGSSRTRVRRRLIQDGDDESLKLNAGWKDGSYSWLGRL